MGAPKKRIVDRKMRKRAVERPPERGLIDGDRVAYFVVGVPFQSYVLVPSR